MADYWQIMLMPIPPPTEPNYFINIPPGWEPFAVLGSCVVCRRLEYESHHLKAHEVPHATEKTYGL